MLSVSNNVYHHTLIFRNFFQKYFKYIYLTSRTIYVVLYQIDIRNAYLYEISNSMYPHINNVYTFQQYNLFVSFLRFIEGNYIYIKILMKSFVSICVHHYEIYEYKREEIFISLFSYLME